MLISNNEVNILHNFSVMIIFMLLLLLTNLHLKLLSSQGIGADKLLSTQRVKLFYEKKFTSLSKMSFNIEYLCHTIINIKHE